MKYRAALVLSAVAIATGYFALRDNTPAAPSAKPPIPDACKPLTFEGKRFTE